VPAHAAFTTVRSHCWQSAGGAPAAAMLRAMSLQLGPPLGARMQPQRLLHYWATWCTPSPAGWAALLGALWVAGDRGQLLIPTLHQAMEGPFHFTSCLQLSSSRAPPLDRARSRILAGLTRSVLLSPAAASAPPHVRIATVLRLFQVTRRA
jgi:hypothetical protein